MRTLLAIDGGNSKTDVVLVAEDGTVLAQARSGPFVPQSAGVPTAVDVAQQAIDQVVRQAREQGAVPRSEATPYADHLVAYLAGADLPEEEEALSLEFAARRFAPDVLVANDTFALLRSGASGPSGVAVVCGAGINAVGVAPDGRIARFPALGRISGDWGGGQVVGEEALWHAARAEDGRGPATALTALVKEHFGVASIERLVLDLHTGATDEADLAFLAPGLLEVASGGDPVARSLVERLAGEVCVLAEVCLRRLDMLNAPAEVVLGGGMLKARDPLLSRLLQEAFEVRAPHAKLVVADLPPIAGAALGGLDRMGAGDRAKARLRSHFGTGR